MLYALILSCFISLNNIENPKLEDIRVVVDNVSNQAGEIMVALFDSQEGFPLNAHKAIKLAKCHAQSGTVTVTIDKVPPGKYAIALFHDTNGDSILNTNLLGIPKEGYGVSNNIKNKFSAPSFQQAEFIHGDSTSLTISLHY
jgi:uncharacterized protein (DUF2141 family)